MVFTFVHLLSNMDVIVKLKIRSFHGHHRMCDPDSMGLS